MNWILAIIIVPKHPVIPDVIFYYVLTPLLTFPLIVMVIMDFPRDQPLIYQAFLAMSTWSWGIYQVIFIELCNYYELPTPGIYPCQGKDFLSTF